MSTQVKNLQVGQVYRILMYIFLSLIFIYPDGISNLYVNMGVRIYFYDIILFFLLFNLRNINIYSKATIKNKEFKVFILWLLYIIINTIYSLTVNDPQDVLGKFRVYFYYSFFLFVLISILELEKEKLQNRLIYLGLLSASIGIIRMISGHGFLDEIFLSNINDTRRYMSVTQATILFLPLNILINRVLKKKYNRYTFIQIMIIVFGIISSNYRTIWINLIIIISIYALIALIKLNFKFLLFIGIFCITGYFLLENYYFIYILSKINDINLNGAIDGRLNLWYLSMDRFYNNKVIGVGIGFKEYLLVRDMTVHNDHIELLRDTGIIGSLLFYLMIMTACFYKRQKKKLSYSLFIINIFISGFFEPIFLQPAGYIILMLTLALISIDKDSGNINKKEELLNKYL